MSLRVFWLAMVSLCCFILPLAAQDARATLLGRVTDLVDAAIPAAKVEAANVDTGVKFNSVTNRTGNYNALSHPQFTAPNTTTASTAFGTVTGEFAWPRVIQFGLKALF